MADLGHNHPKPDPVEIGQAFDELLKRHDELRAKVIAGAERVKIQDDEDLGRAADTIKIIDTLLEDIETDRVDVGRAYYDTAGQVNGRAVTYRDDAEHARAAVLEKIEAYTDAKKERAHAAELEQRRAEDARRAALNPAPPSSMPSAQSLTADPPPPLSSRGPAPAAKPERKAYKVRGELGATVGTTKTVTITVEDVRKVPIDILNSPKVTEAIISVARDFAKHKSEIEGLAIVRGSGVAIRRR